MPDTQRLNAENCPRCGCFMVKHIECNCGAIHGDCCSNCGRYAAPTLRRDEYVEFDPAFDQRCALGAVGHFHARTPMDHRLVIEVKPDDGGPVDAEHVEAVVALNKGATLEAVQQKLRECARPATAREWVDA